MTTTIRIAKAELKTLFYSPIAWFLLIVFLFQCGLEYTSNIEAFVTQQGLGGLYAQNLKNLTDFTVGRNGLFGMILAKGYLYLPLLTMGLISRELSSGSIKLLYSSPIRIREIIMGKFLAMMIYIFLLILIITLFVISGAVNVGHAETGIMLSGLFSLYLLFCTYAAIGLFMSCLTAYQVVAAISTLVVFALLSYMDSVWQDVPLIRDLTYFLSISGRTGNMMAGLISTKDVLYYLIIICMFLGFSICKLQSARTSDPKLLVAFKYILVMGICLSIGYVISLPRFTFYYDATHTKEMTLTLNSQRLLKELGPGPLEVKTFANLLDQNYFTGDPTQWNNNIRRWEPYLRFKPDIRLSYVYYYDSVSADQKLFGSNPGKTMEQITQQYAKMYGVDIKTFKTPEQMHQLIDLRPEQNRYIMQLRHNKSATFLRLFNDPLRFPTETETDAALSRLIAPSPKIGFLEGESERSISDIREKDYRMLTRETTFRNALVNQGFEFQTISLAMGEVPADLAVLVIADPRIPFSTDVMARLKRYTDQGGNLLIAGEPGKQDILNPLIGPMGVQLMKGQLVQKSERYAPQVVMSLLTTGGADLSGSLKKPFHDSIPVSMPGAVGLSYTTGRTFSVTPLLTIDDRYAWNRAGGLPSDSGDVHFSPAVGDSSGSIPTALALTRRMKGREQRIIVTGDADFLSNSELRVGRGANFTFSTAVFGWYTYGRFPIDTSRPAKEDNRLTLSDAGLARLKILFLGVLPGALLIFGVVFLLLRKRK